MTKNANTLGFETVCAFDQLTRYGYGVENVQILHVLQKLTDINDDVANARSPELVQQQVEEAKALLDAVAEEYSKGT